MHLHLCYALIPILLAQVAAAASNDNALRINTDLTARIVGDMQAAQNTQQQNKLEKLTKAELPLIAHNNFENPNRTHICTREETYSEELRIPKMQPVRVRTSKWCLEFPPRCSNYKTEMREVVKIEQVNKTRTIRFCCDGYEGNISINDTVCKPVCRGGCGRGHCQTPDVCSCEAGYTGKHCTQRCDHDRWGDACKNQCECQNDAVCDNKSGLCHCTAGWTGAFCELPCPAGTYGIMCRNACNCADKRCHPKTGECTTPTSPPAATTTSANVTHVMIETLNSTIVNITHNLDRIAKNIVHIATTSTTESELAALKTQQPPAKAMPEVILIKQEEPHTPKIILHTPGTGLLDNLHSAGAHTPDVIHVITNWPANATHEGKLNLAGYGGIAPAHHEPAHKTANDHNEHETNLLTILLIILLIIVVAVIVSFLYVYRRYHWQRERAETALAAHNGGAATQRDGNVEVVLNESNFGKNFLKPLPDLPAFTQMMRNKIEGPELYDSPSNNSSIKTPPYAYARKESLYSVINHKSRAGSMDSHLYDEIRYPLKQQQQLRHQHMQHLQQQQQQQQYHHHHHQQQQQQQLHYALDPTASAQHSSSELAVPPQNVNFLQVPSPISRHSHRVAHI